MIIIKPALLGVFLLILSMGVSAQWTYGPPSSGPFSTRLTVSARNDDAELEMLFYCSGDRILVAVRNIDIENNFGPLFAAVRLQLRVDTGSVFDAYNEAAAMETSMIIFLYPFPANMDIVIQEMLLGDVLHIRTTDSDDNVLSGQISLSGFDTEIQKLPCFRNSGL